MGGCCWICPLGPAWQAHPHRCPGLGVWEHGEVLLGRGLSREVDEVCSLPCHPPPPRPVLATFWAWKPSLAAPSLGTETAKGSRVHLLLTRVLGRTGGRSPQTCICSVACCQP